MGSTSFHVLGISYHRLMRKESLSAEDSSRRYGDRYKAPIAPRGRTGERRTGMHMAVNCAAPLRGRCAGGLLNRSAPERNGGPGRQSMVGSLTPRSLFGPFSRERKDVSSDCTCLDNLLSPPENADKSRSCSPRHQICAKSTVFTQSISAHGTWQ